MSAPNTEATGKPTPIAGCMIFCVLLGMATFIAVFSTYQYKEYKAEIINISQLEQKKTAVASLDDKTKVDAFDQKMKAFEKAVKAGEKSTLNLKAEELNLAIALFPKLESFEGEMYIREITEKAIIADISFPVRAGFDGDRYLNGSMTMKPVIAMGSVFPVVSEISPDTGNPVPPKMTREFPTLLFTEYRNDEELSEVFHKLSKVTLSNGMISILSDPAIEQPDALPDDVEYEANRAIYVFGLLIFMFISTIAFILWYKKFRQQQ